MKTRKFLVLIVALICVFALVACDRGAGLDNEKDALIVQESTMDGVFNPFFYSSAYDGDVCGFVNVGLLTMDASGAVVAGDDYPTVAKSYSIYYQDANGVKKETFAEGDEVVYEMIIKKGGKFSDGQPVTADDVLFNYYVLLDPAYVGSSTLYTLPIKGLNEYRTQASTATYNEVFPKGEKIFADLADNELGEYAATEEYTADEYALFKEIFDEVSEGFAQAIIDYVNNKYGASYFEDGYGPEGVKYANATQAQKNAYGFSLWGFGFTGGVAKSATEGSFYKYGYEYALEEDAEGTRVIVADEEHEGEFVVAKYNEEMGDVTRYKIGALVSADKFVAATGDEFDVTATGSLTAADYAAVIFEAYEYDLMNAFDTETATDLDGEGYKKDIINKFVAKVAAERNEKIETIAGLVKETNAEGYEVVKVILTEQNPKAILSLGVTVTPKHYYTAGYTYTKDIKPYGVEFDSKDFFDHLHTFDGAPVGAGTYKMNLEDGASFVRNGDVYFVRNEYFETMGGENVYNAKIKYVVMKIVASGAEYNAVEAGDVHYATVSATADVVSDVKNNKKLTAVLVDNLGYGYICVNPSQTPNLYERIALNTVFDLSKVYDYYPNGLADVIYRSQSQVSWAYPEGAKAIYEYDETLATAIAYFKKAGFTYDEATKKFTDAKEYTFTLPSEVNDHPAGGIFLKAQELLKTIGITANLKTDESLIANIKKGDVAVYALAWQSSADPDMYQVYHYESAAESVTSNGIKWLEKEGKDDALGTIEVTKLDGSKVTMNQGQALDYLAELIEEGVKYMLVEERKPIYNKALEVLAQLAIEIPTYQRKNLFVYDSYVIDSASLSANVTPYWGPLAEIWKASFAK